VENGVKGYNRVKTGGRMFTPVILDQPVSGDARLKLA
jgi:hypothetical protein